MNHRESVKIVELTANDVLLPQLTSKYSASGCYDLSIRAELGRWQIALILRPLEKTLEKNYRGKLFEEYVNEPRVFAAVLDGKQVGCIELGYDKWNNRMRVWELLVEEEYRRRGIGTKLMKHAVLVAREKGARMLVLETQSNNSSAISFYLGLRFELIGFDAAAYSNEDIEKKEVRLEFGLKLQP